MAAKPLPAYDGDEPYIFVSYSHTDDDLVYPEIRWLQDHGFNVWYDEGISGASRWRDAIAGRLGGCQLLLFYVSPNSVESRVCREELEYVLDLDRPVLSVYLQPTVLPEGIKLAISNRQALHRQELESEDYERKLVSAVATYLDRAIPEISKRLPSRRSPRSVVVILSVACVVLSGALVASMFSKVTRSETSMSREVSRFDLTLPEGVTLPVLVTEPFALSQDGRHLVFIGESSEGTRIYLRSMNEVEASPIQGSELNTESSVFLSPDGDSVIFYDRTDRALKLIPVTGGRPTTLVKDMEQGPAGLSMGRDGTIVYGDMNGRPLMRVATRANDPEPLASPNDGQFYAHPQLVADGTAVLFSIGQQSVTDHIAVLSLVTGEQRIVTEGGYPHVTSSGYLVFRHENSIWAAPFDSKTLSITGDAVPVLDDVWLYFSRGISVAQDGSMVYLPDAFSPADEVAWRNLDGRESLLSIPAGSYLQPRTSPDGRKVVVRRGPETLQRGGNLGGIWVHSIDRNTFTKVSGESVLTLMWTTDSEEIIYTHGVDRSLHRIKWDGTGVDERLTTTPSDVAQFATSRSSDGQQVLFYECDTRSTLGACDLGRLSLTGESGGELFLQTEFNERHPALSPDGLWIAYESDRSGRFEIYVRPYPDVESGRWKISMDGGRQPLWSPNGDTLYYSAGVEGDSLNRTLMSVAIETSRGFTPGNTKPVFNFLQHHWRELRSHDLHPSDKRFLIVKSGNPAGGANRLVFVQNWLDEVESLVPSRR